MNAPKWFAAIFFFMLLTGCAELETSETTQEETEHQREVVQSQEESSVSEDEHDVVEEAKADAERLEKENQEAAKNEQGQLAESLKLELITVGRVIDGDTFETTDGRKVRLVGVNTPESTSKVEEYGKDASNYTASKLSEKQVWIQKDVSDTDRYNRFLRIVWLEIPTDDMDENEIRTKMFNADLVLNGYAEPSSYPPDIKYSDYFVKFAREARDENTGLWAFGEEGTTKGDLDTKLLESSNNSSSSPDSNSDSTNTYSNTYVSYKNCTALREVYPDGVPSTHPAYASKHDRDKDNWACER